MSTMINTFHSSFNPPPVPPRSGHRGPALPSNTPLVKFLSVMLLLLMIQTFGGFLYLFHRLNTLQDRRSDYEISNLKQLQRCAETNLEPEDVQYCSKLVENYKTVITKVSQAERRVDWFVDTGSSIIPQARMVSLKNYSLIKEQTNTLLWDSTHSTLDKISLKLLGALRIHYPGFYLIQSQVTFSKAHKQATLKQTIWTQKRTENSPSKLIEASCSLPRNSEVPDLCTASQTGVFSLEKDQVLFVNVTDRSLVNLDSTTLGLFRLQN